MKKVFLLTVFLLYLSNASAQEAKTCNSKNQIIEDLNSIEKCDVLSKKNVSNKTNRKALAKTRFLRKRSSKRKTAISLSNSVNSKTAQNSIVDEIAQKKWKEIKLLAKKISENSNYLEKELVNFNTVQEIPQFSKCKNVDEYEKYDCFNTQISNHIRKHFKYPKKTLNGYTQGSIIVEFTINKKGEVENIQTTGNKNVKFLKKEAARVIEKLPRFIPGKHKGKVVNIKYIMPINFKL